MVSISIFDGNVYTSSFQFIFSFLPLSFLRSFDPVTFTCRKVLSPFVAHDSTKRNRKRNAFLFTGHLHLPISENGTSTTTTTGSNFHSNKEQKWKHFLSALLCASTTKNRFKLALVVAKNCFPSASLAFYFDRKFNCIESPIMSVRMR